MSRLADRVQEKAQPAAYSIDLAALRAAKVQAEPFAYLIVPGFVLSPALDSIGADFPAIARPGSFPLASLRFGPRFAAFIADLQGPELTRIVGEKLGLDLERFPTMVTVRGQSREGDGQIHTDSTSKLVTALIYMNDTWESPRGRLRLVRSAGDLNDVVAEVPPERGTLLLFRNGANAWHGFEPFAGPRRVIQLNWVTSAGVVRREQARHRISAFFKRLTKRSG